MGVSEIEDIPGGFPLNETQARVRDSVIAGKDWASEELASEISAITFPVYHLDFEAFMPAIPLFAQTRPFDTVPFQYSIHKESEQGALEHREYLCTNGEDPRRPLAEQLLADLGNRGHICVYSPYEKRIISMLARRFPDLRQALEGLIERLWDLLPIVRSHYYHPDFKGSYSIKAVLPVLVPALSYDDMEIAGGLAAAAMYEIARTSEDEAARNKIYENLRAYCGQDTIAMVELRRALAKRARYGKLRQCIKSES